MPTDRRLQNPKKYAKRPWHARTKVNGIVYSIGYHATWDEAKDAEIELRNYLLAKE